MKILLTGAHFTAAVAVIEELQKKPDLKIIYVGRRSTQEGDQTPSAESQILPKMGVKFIPITTGRLQRTFTIYTIPSLLKIPVGFLQASWIILKEKPDVVVSFGGYVGVPLIILSWFLSIPILIHEQTLVTGLANKISGWFADKIAISFEADHDFNREKVILTGNPIRREIINPSKKLPTDFQKIFDRAKKEKLPVILITGGNQGSHVINKSVQEILSDLLKKVSVIHQTGDSKFHDFENLEKLQNEKYLVKKFVGNEMGAVLSKVDLVVSRAGINILTELSFLRKPALVIPVPHLFADEQNKNALFFASLGLVKVLPQAILSRKTLLSNIKSCLNELSHLKSKDDEIKKVFIPDAAKRLALEILLLGN